MFASRVLPELALVARAGPAAVHAALLLAALASAPASARAQAPPNIVLFLADDVGYGDLGPYDHDENPNTPAVTNTPVLDALAAAGVRLTDYYSGSPVCSPSRAALLTGRHSARIGVTGALDAFDPNGLPPEETTIAEILRARGYATGLFGKWHLGSSAPLQPLSQGFETFHGVLYSNDMFPFCLQQDFDVLECETDQCELTSGFTQHAKDFLTNSVASARPFFLFVPYVSTHVPVHVSTAFEGVTGRGLYADAMREMDDSVGQVLAHLAALGVDDETLVVFTSDNGPWHGNPPGSAQEPWRWVGGSHGPLRGWKGDVLEGGVRVPFVARWPGFIPPGTVSDQPVVGTDLFVTFARCAAAGVPTDRVIDGRDVRPVLTGSGTVPAQDLCFYRPYRSINYGTRELRAMRSGRWKLHFTADLAPAELYDLFVDPGETTPIEDPLLTAQLADRARTFDCGLDDGPTAPPLGPNLALHAPASASSSLDCATSLDAVDGLASTWWRSEPGDVHWVATDLGAVRAVERVVLQWGDAYALQYEVEISLDGETWTTVHTNPQGNGGVDVVHVGAPVRHVRMRGLKSIGSTGFALRELKVIRRMGQAGLAN